MFNVVIVSELGLTALSHLAFCRSQSLCFPQHHIQDVLDSCAVPSHHTPVLDYIGTTYRGNMVCGSRSYTWDEHFSSILQTRSSGIHPDTIFRSFSWSRIGGRVHWVERCAESRNMSLCFLAFCRTNRILHFQVEHYCMLRVTPTTLLLLFRAVKCHCSWN
jgi:hypothetical protein